MENSNDPFKEAIANYLNEVAAKDEMFAMTMCKQNKNIDDCATYILNTVKKSGRQGFADDEIYAMAIHYYDEDSIVIGEKISARVIVNQPLAAPVTKFNSSQKSSSKNVDANQTTLFI
ncbi:MAG: Cas9 inhibitor AcrIIA9 family protein [Flavobacterium sp.]